MLCLRLPCDVATPKSPKSVPISTKALHVSRASITTQQTMVLLMCSNIHVHQSNASKQESESSNSFVWRYDFRLAAVMTF